MKRRMTIKIENLVPSVFNPPGRTSPTAVRSLRENVSANGIHSAIHVIPAKDGRYVIVDGHRRYAIAQDLGIHALEAVVHDRPIEDAAALWADLNRNTRNISSYEWMHYWYETGCDLKSKMIPRGTLGDIRDVREVFGGNEGVELLLQAKIAPRIAWRIKQVASVIDRYRLKDGLKAPSPKELGLWVIRHKASTVVSMIVKMHNGKSIDMLVRRVAADKPLSWNEVPIVSRKGA